MRFAAGCQEGHTEIVSEIHPERAHTPRRSRTDRERIHLAPRAESREPGIGAKWPGRTGDTSTANERLSLCLLLARLYGRLLRDSPRRPAPSRRRALSRSRNEMKDGDE